jgi:hypothetical protein
MPMSDAGRANRLLRFFSSVRPLLQTHGRRAERSVDPERLQQTFAALRPLLDQRRAAGDFFNVWQVAGLGRNEVRNAAVLASFLSVNKLGILGRLFLADIVSRARGRVVDFEVADVSGPYSVTTELCPLGNRETRIDLIIEGREFVLGIEVKIDAHERPGQLADYLEILRHKAKPLDKHVGLIFLSPRPSAERPEGVPHLTWQDINVAGKHAVRAAGRNSEASFHLLQFCEHIRTFRDVTRSFIKQTHPRKFG